MFNNDDTARLTRTPSSAGNRRTFTTSFWFKLGNLTSQRLFTAQQASGTPFYTIDIFQDAHPDVRGIRVNSSANSDELMLITNGRLRDNSAWYHLVVAVDTTQGTAANRCKIYLNGVQLTDFATETYPSQNYDTPCNNTLRHNIGAKGDAGNPFDGYMAEFHHIDGTALTPASFGETDDDYGHWKPKKVSGLTYGTNGFSLSFAGGGIIAATGGTITTDGDYKVHTFTSNGTFTPTSVGSDNYVEYLVIGGGGSGGQGYRTDGVTRSGGGGGAGGYRTGVLTVTAQAYSITVGAGGAAVAPLSGAGANPGLAGSNSVFSSITATGGGGGGSGHGGGPGNGGSGGGGAHHDTSGGSANAGFEQGTDGGRGQEGGSTGGYHAGGGGGAGGAGAGGSTDTTGNGAGGAGKTSYITGTGVTRAGGGGGAGTHAVGAAGSGGATAGDSHATPTANTGSGGGGAGYSNGSSSAGAAGVVIIRYKYQ